MSKFKAGDKVITTQCGGWYDAGEEYTLSSRYVNAQTKTVGWFVKEKDTSLFVHENRIKLASPKSMLKNGMRVKCRNGKMHTVIDNGLLSIRPDGTSMFQSANLEESYNDTLENSHAAVYDIVEIHERPRLICYYFDYKVVTDIVWKLENKTDKQLQLEELQKKAQEIADAIEKLRDEE